MLQKRLIPCLLISNRGLYKSEGFSKWRYLGDPINTIKIFNDKGADEIIILDISVSKEKRLPDFEYIEELAGECFMPMTYGGGISCIEHVDQLIASGIEKISINSYCFTKDSLIREIADKYGSQAITVSVDIKKNLFGKYKIYNHVQKSLSSKNVEDHLKESINKGAGEIMINSVDNDGMMKGLDLKLYEKVSSLLSVPIIFMGGVGQKKDILDGFDLGINAIGVGSFFVYKGPLKGILISYLNLDDYQ